MPQCIVPVIRMKSASDVGVVILRVKNGFEPAVGVYSNGYRDIKVKVWIPCDHAKVRLAS